MLAHLVLLIDKTWQLRFENGDVQEDLSRIFEVIEPPEEIAGDIAKCFPLIVNLAQSCLDTENESSLKTLKEILCKLVLSIDRTWALRNTDPDTDDVPKDLERILNLFLDDDSNESTSDESTSSEDETARRERNIENEQKRALTSAIQSTPSLAVELANLCMNNHNLDSWFEKLEDVIVMLGKAFMKPKRAEKYLQKPRIHTVLT